MARGTSNASNAWPITVDELVQEMSQFRWIEVLTVISQLRNEGRLGLLEHERRIKIYSVDSEKRLKKSKMLAKREHKCSELTVS